MMSHGEMRQDARQEKWVLYSATLLSNLMTRRHHSSARNIDPLSEPLPITVWVEPKGASASYYVDTRDVTADPFRGIADAYEQHLGTEVQYPVVAIIDERLPISVIEQLRELIGKAGCRNVRYFLTSPSSRSMCEISFGQVTGLPKAVGIPPKNVAE